MGHDLFEVLVSYDLALFIGHLGPKHFTYLQLNGCKNQFSYQENDASSKPCLLLVDDQVSMRFRYWSCFFYLWVAERITATHSAAERDCGTCLCTSYYNRPSDFWKSSWKNMCLVVEGYSRPKLPYLCRYPELTPHFGPFIHLWTLQFESKHTFFKQCARKLHNFTNICKTLAERHQLLQAYLSEGSLFRSACWERWSDYNDKIRASRLIKILSHSLQLPAMRSQWKAQHTEKACVFCLRVLMKNLLLEN